MSKEASKETVDNLIKNSTQTIEDLYSKVRVENERLGLCDESVPVLLKLTAELRRDVRFTLLDMLASLRACLNASHYYEKIFHIRILEGIRVEGYNLLYGFVKTREFAIWTRIGAALGERTLSAVEGEVKDTYNSLFGLYNKITGLFESLALSNEERTSRNLTYHYDKELLKMFEQLIKVQKGGEDPAIKKITPWMDLLLWIQFFCDSIEIVEASQGSALLSKVPARFGEINALSLHLYSKLAGELNRKVKLHEALGMALDKVERINWASLQKKRLLKFEEWLSERNPEIEQPKVIVDFADLLNVSILVFVFFADLASVMNAFMRADGEVESPLYFRRIAITKVAVLSHLVGYDEKEKNVSLWPLVLKSIPENENGFRDEAIAIQGELESLVKEEDLSTRGLYVHLMDPYSHESNVPNMISTIEGFDLIKEIEPTSKLIQALGHVKKFLGKWMIAFVIRTGKEAKESNMRTKARIQEFKDLVNDSQCAEEVKKQFVEAMDKIEGMFDLSRDS